METIIESIKSKKLEPEDIPKLILNFSFISEADEEILERYGSSQGAMTWGNFRIILHDTLKERNDEGNLNYNVGHHLNHEIGHSITEIGAISQEEIKDIFNVIGVTFESAHIQRLITHNAPEDLILKERFAECVGIYLRSNSLQEFFENRSQNCAKKADQDFENEGSQQEFLEESQRLYERMNKIWPSIKTRLTETDLSEHINQALGGYEENLAPFDETEIIDKTNIQTSDESDQQPATSSTDIGSANGKEATTSTTQYGETPELAKDQKHSESFNQAIKNLIGDFADTVNVFQGTT